MEVSSSSSHPKCDIEEKALVALLDAFGSTFELREIASAYCRAEGNVDLAGEILYNSHGENSSSSSAASSVKSDDKSTDVVKSSKVSKAKKVTISVGTVSSVIGKGYCRSTASEKHLTKGKKPVKLEVRYPPSQGLNCDPVGSDFAPRTKPPNNRDVEDFLYKMLGDGFQLEMDVIQEVLRSCGYDARKGMEKLLSMSSAKSNKTDDDVLSKSVLMENAQNQNCGGRNEIEEGSSMKNTYSDSAMDILNAWYTPSVIPKDDSPEETCKLSRVRHANRKVVSGNPDDITSRYSSKILKLQVEGSGEVEDDDKYDALRRASKVSWDAMMAYYEAAVDAFVSGKHDRIDYLVEQGKRFHEKAREADDKSAEEMNEIRKANTSTVVTLDLHEQQTREARRLLKLQLSSFSGIPSVHYLNVIVDSGDDTITKGARKRMVIKLLEKHGIRWNEENMGTIKIKVDEIDPRNLSFAKITGY
ncbi:hypothetical protein H6P81_016895 [Aristolochia fimbriata]|uniref:DUF1771 domain-containing protein n=1 Tax=Aristolochia fimbriata TaxID=158543 RepID=A0AAV7DZL4_ARIFI|nr:hypothetical protein H6P81_016895 [Aristolochia fimbriata]